MVQFFHYFRTSRTILKTYGESGQPCLLPDFRGIASSFFPFILMLAIGLLYIAFIMLRYVPVIPDFSKTFIMKGCWILSKAFSASNEIIVCFFSSVFLYDGFHLWIFIY
ncbi:hypothetical protein H671_xg20225 [Cricetulus griseus]|uniref:Uncharacterized protein n=1 Tax=Cricetulus griseus TaxID=10029 RepID=A0A061HUS6_CRIGR|nr:hypothetical protein H671_xg20225 [Cricetulus griseus]